MASLNFNTADAQEPSPSPVYTSPPVIDQEQAERFLITLGADPDTTTFQVFPEKGTTGGGYPEVIPGNTPNLFTLLKEKNRTCGVFVTPNATDGQGRKDKNITGVRAAYLDLDGVPLTPVLDAGLRPHIIVESSPGKFHVYWLVSDCRLDQFTPLQKALAEQFDGDPAINDLPRVMRLPGFIHGKHGVRSLSRIIEDNDSPPYTVAEIVAGLQLEPFLNPPKPEAIKEAKQQATNGDRPGDDFNRSATWGDVLTPAGWTLKSTRSDGTQLWCKPGHTGQQSATVNYAGSDLLFCYSDSAGLPVQEGLSKYAVYTYLHHGGDFAAASRALRLKGYGGDSPAPATSAPGPAQDGPEAWGDPVALPRDLHPVKPLHRDMLPLPLRAWIFDIAERMQVPPDFPAAAAVVTLAAVVGRACGIHPKRHDNWLVVPNLWGGIVGRPSLMKSPAMNAAQAPLYRLIRLADDDHQAALEGHEVQKLVTKTRRDDLEKRLKEAVKNNKPLADIQAAFRENAEEVAPIRRRYVTTDGTTEKIGELLIENPRGFLVNRDELIGWMKTLEKSGREGDREFYLQAWNGYGSYTYDRIGRGTVDVPHTCLSVFGATTPGPLSSYVYQATKGGAGDDGLMQRFQVMVYPDAPAEWKNVDRYPDRPEANRAFEIFKRLAGDDCYPDIEEGAECPALRFTGGAQALFNEWREEQEPRLRGGHLPPVMESHLAKYKSLMPSLALLFHLAEVADGTAEGHVSEGAALMSLAWCDYLESHAGRIYGAATSPGMEAAREIVKHIRRGAVKDGMTTRELWRPQWSKLRTPGEVAAGLEVLDAFEWLKVDKTTTTGRPSEVVRLNPKILLDT